MTQQVKGMKIMLMVSNGFTQGDFITLQRSFITAGAEVTVVSSEKNLVNGFNGNEWGLTFPVNQNIDSVLGSDFDVVIIPGGEQSVNRLESNPHSGRIIDSFNDMEKPVVLLNEATRFANDSNDFVMRVEGEVTEDVIQSIADHIAPSSVAKAA